mmetsp:Transcript_11832/g.17639  ORF Transcript_11832/g.17639 Transcript_11832/m.17639 type:complete len:83 (-) Transcript_11832:49-297(-)|eukprot:CAMPEP_0171454262 /NCGR_PEP_ID=MMETSP0945-20130129/1620_1 /TAXON_ID=109269 /ORGANISM="Vaucheria litorea, Strain CCMP2940" /LENGTH=82 /DNA_ID=CAMNT_0011979253 /DNA_START=69 /DNA_END=317 /DNA_ORIENTATION=+
MADKNEGIARPARATGAAGAAAQVRGSKAKQPARGSNQQAGILKFYTDDAPGIQFGPTVILAFSLSFIGCVVLLHIWGKLRG